MHSIQDRERIEMAAKRYSPSERFIKAINAIDLLNDDDPNRVAHEGRDVGCELFFSRLLFEKAMELETEPSEALLLAARSQHICRWKIPRADYPEGRAGYLKWRSDLKRYHAQVTAELLEEKGYEPAVIEAVRAINLKKGLGSRSDAQTIEDALCLVFLQHQLEEFRKKTDEEKVISILRKTWAKMSERGQEAALNLPLSDESKQLVATALGN